MNNDNQTSSHSQGAMVDLLFNTIGMLLLIVSMCSFAENQAVAKESQEDDSIKHINPSDSQGKGAMITSKVVLDIVVKESNFIVCIDKQRYDMADLTSYLNTIGDAGGDVAIRSEGNVEVGFYLNIIKLCQQSGISNISQIIKI